MQTNEDDKVLEVIVADPGDSTIVGRPIGIVADLTRIKEPLWVGLGYWKSWLEDGNEEHRKRAVNSLLKFRSEALQNEKQLKDPAQSYLGIFVNDLECESGVIRIIDPNKRYGKGEGRYLLKKLSIKEADRNYQDWLNCFAPESSINLTELGVQSAEMLRKPLPIDDKDAFILQEDLIGPSSASVLSMLNKSNDPRAAKIRETIISQRIHEYMAWRDNVPTLMSQKNYPIERVIKGYIHRFTHFFRKFGENTGSTIPQDQIKAAKEAINSLPWDDIIKQDTLMRYFSGTFRNSVVKTNKVNISAEEIIEMFSNGGNVDIDAIRKNMYTIDHSVKDSQRMEDVCEIINNPHARLSGDEKLGYWNRIGHSDPYKDQAALVMMIYRNCRVADLFRNVYLLKMTAKNQKGILSNEQFKENEQLYISIIQDQISQAMDMTNKLYNLSQKSSLTKLARSLGACLDRSDSKIILP